LVGPVWGGLGKGRELKEGRIEAFKLPLKGFLGLKGFLKEGPGG